MGTNLSNNDSCQPIVQTVYNVSYVELYDGKNASRCVSSFDTIKDLKNFITKYNIIPIKITKTIIIVTEEEIKIFNN